MIIAFSTSSAWASVAMVDRRLGVLWSGSEYAPQAASGACLRLLESMVSATGKSLEDAEMFAADIGPGSFTGVRGGVTLAKTFGYLYSRPVAGATSFDLISIAETVVLSLLLPPRPVEARSISRPALGSRDRGHTFSKALARNFTVQSCGSLWT